VPDRPIDYPAGFEQAAANVAAALERADPEAAVPACPGWTVADLALHLGSGQRWAAAVLLSGTRQRVPEVLRTTISWSDWYAGTTAALLAAIYAVDPDETCWNFAPVDQRAAFWARRRMHETLIHLVDLAQAAVATGEPDSGSAVAAPELAADGVAEIFEVFLPRMAARGAAPAVTRQVGVRAVDTGHEWTLIPAAQGLPPRIEYGVAEGDAVVSGTASDLELVLWKRLPTDRLTVAGDPGVAGAFLGARATP
jgi:uncharacterized protein (TIGR03083 family)